MDASRTIGPDRTQLFRDLDALPDAARGAVIAIGNFDGVHRGHVAVVTMARRLAAELSVPAGVLTFEPHPRSIFAPDGPPFRLTPFRIKAERLAALGIDLIFAQRFSQEFSRHGAEEFVTDWLVGRLGVRHVVVGYDFVFGKDRRGDSALLYRMGAELGFGFTALDAVLSPGGDEHSSTQIRQLLQAADPAGASAMLGHPWEIEGHVTHGDKRGRELGIPTANIALGDFVRPANGVYAVRAALEEAGKLVWRDGVANLGIRPMYAVDEPLLEVHLFDFDGDLYGAIMRVALIDYLRPEANFDSVEVLVDQMLQDCVAARAILAGLAPWDGMTSDPIALDAG